MEMKYVVVIKVDYWKLQFKFTEACEAVEFAEKAMRQFDKGSLDRDEKLSVYILVEEEKADEENELELQS